MTTVQIQLPTPTIYHPSVPPLIQGPPPPRKLHPKRELSDLEQAWQDGHHGLSFSPESQPRIRKLPDPRSLSWGEIAKTQPAPKSPEGHRRLNPYRPIRTDRFEVPSEHALAAEAGIQLLDIDRTVSHDWSGSLTLADVVVDRVHGHTYDDDRGDDFEGPAPFTTRDVREQERIEWEQVRHYSGPVTRLRRKHNGQNSFVAIDRGGTRLYIRRDRNDQLVYVFEKPKPFQYARVVDAYIARITKALGYLPTWEDQVQMAAEGLNEALQRERPRVPLADREHHPLATQLDHEPYEEQVLAEDCLTDVLAVRHYGRKLDALWPEELQELTEAAMRRWPDRVTTRRHLRGHPDWPTAAAAQLHIGDYLASDEDILA